ncbi:hypothetical protein B0J14DRAFT_655966 [Halenospora varia]|nr:hypothetical protein B0J14DRAFT_655966 [Halenospora varia]
MGRNGRKREVAIDWDEIAAGDSHESGSIAHNGNGSRGRMGNGNGRGNPQDDRQNAGNVEDKDLQTEPVSDLYLEGLEELESQMVVCQNVMKNFHNIYGKQRRAIQDAVETRQRLGDMTKQCKKLKTTIETLKNFEEEKDKKAKEQAAEDKQQLEDKKEKFDDRMKLAELEQQAKLSQQKTDLEKTLDEQYRKCVEKLEREMKERQDGDRKRMADLEAKNEELEEKLEDEKSKLRQSEGKCKDTDMLKTFYERETENLREDLKMAENEFDLNVGTTESYKEKFLKIHNDIQDISSRYKELPVGDLNAIHDKIEKADEDFTSVPISISETSEKLRVVHAQRVIAAQLQQIIWQPFSSETTLQDPKYESLFSQISEGLIKSYGKSGGLRAARFCTALSMRGLQSRPPVVQSSSTSKSSASSRAEVFTDKVMAVLSLLVETPLHTELRNNLLDLAASAISVWNIAQTDEREFVAYPTLDPEGIDGWRENISAPNNEVIVMFPRIVARTCSRVADTRPVGPPGMWIDSEPDSYSQETCCIHGGMGLGKWSALVLEGEEEEEERREEEDRKERDETRRRLEEDLKKLEDPVIGHRRGGSQSKRNSITGSGSRPSVEWMKGGGQRIIEAVD